MNDLQKEQLVKSIEKKYKNRKGFKNIFGKAQREIYRDDILQPYQREFRDRWQSSFKAKELIDQSIERQEIQKEKDLNNIYRSKLSKNVVTKEQKVLKDVHLEHPTMVSKEDIIKW